MCSIGGRYALPVADAPADFRFPRAHRLSGAKAFTAAFDHKLRKNIGPITVIAKPNGLSHNRLGLSVPRRVGNAVRRNRVKRLLREAYRLNRHGWPTGYDLVIAVRPHPTMELADYARLLGQGVEQVDRESQRRLRRDAERGAP